MVFVTLFASRKRQVNAIVKDKLHTTTNQTLEGFKTETGKSDPAADLKEPCAINQKELISIKERESMTQ